MTSSYKDGDRVFAYSSNFTVFIKSNSYCINSRIDSALRDFDIGCRLTRYRDKTVCLVLIEPRIKQVGWRVTSAFMISYIFYY